MHHGPSNSYFYYNLFTGEMAWEDPRALYGRKLAEGIEGMPYELIKQHGDYTQLRETGTAHMIFIENATGQIWEKHWDASRRAFFHNQESGETVWRLPGREAFNPLSKFETENAPMLEK